MRLRPFFSYYGGKSKIAQRYPVPEHRTIIEPFAGTAGYATLHHERRVRLYDVNPIIVGVWSYLIRASSREILELPLAFDHVDDVKACQEARWLLGYWLNTGNANPCKTPSAWMRSGKWPGSFWGERVRERLARQVEAIRHWRVEQRSYADVPDVRATWFVDPPYSGRGGRFYWKHSRVDYPHLAAWVRSRSGLVIACEAAGADWLPFEPFTVAPARRGVGKSRVSHEVIYTQRGDGRAPQLEMFEEVA